MCRVPLPSPILMCGFRMLDVLSLPARAAVQAPARVESRPADPAESAQAETIIYACGTYAPGDVHEPCQHSLVYVMCCACAGCSRDVWACQGPPLASSWLVWQVQLASSWCERVAFTPAALWFYAIVTGLVLLVGLQCAPLETAGLMAAGLLMAGVAVVIRPD